MSEEAAPLSFKLLLQEAAGSAAAPKLERSVPQPLPHQARSRGPHLLLPGRAPWRPFQRGAGALAAQTAQSGCAQGWAGPAGGESQSDLLSGPAPPLPPTGWPAPGARSPYSQIPNLAGRTRLERKTGNGAPNPNVRLPKSYQSSSPRLRPTRGRSAKVKAGEGGGAGVGRGRKDGVGQTGRIGLPRSGGRDGVGARTP